MRRRRTFTATLVGAVLLVGAPLGAQVGACREAQLVGHRARMEGRDAEALAQFERAYALCPSSRVLVQRGLAHAALRHHAEAIADLEAALAHPEGLSAVARVAAQATLVQSREASAALRPSAPAIEVAPMAASRPSESPTVSTVPAPLVIAPPTPVPRWQTARDESRWTSPVGPWIVGGALLATSLALTLFRQPLVSEWNSEACIGMGLSRIENCPMLRQRMDALETGALVTAVSGVALGVVGLALFMRRRERAHWLDAHCVPSVEGLSCVGRF